MYSAIPGDVKQKLWAHQVDALKFAVARLNSADLSCLIRMPTGTGKTGVIACLGGISNAGSTLVLTPWAHLRNQMVDDLKQEFWDKIGIPPIAFPVDPMLPTTVGKLLQAQQRRIFVSTFATLNELRLDYPQMYDALAAAISLVLVDEGHYEPAVEWGKSVKGLKAKTVLLTATPYRNDLKLFRISDPQKSTHHFTHAAAVPKIIRRLTFGALPPTADVTDLASAFAKWWKNAKKSQKLPSRSPRSIICCSSAGAIEEVVSRLRILGVDAIGIHEQFEKSSDPHLRREVPDPKSTGADVWVHQFKLMEGLDDHRFCCLALFCRIQNDRRLIQQIGRILRRHDTDHAAAPAILLAPPEYSVDAEWDAYLEFETDLKLLEPEHFREVVDALLSSQPPVEYFDGKFRRRFQPGDLGKDPQVVIPPSVLVRAVGRPFSLKAYVEDCTDTLNTEDAVILGPNVNGPCQQGPDYALWIYASVRNAPFLQNASLYEIELATHCVVVSEGYVFIADSGGNMPAEYLEHNTTPVGSEMLARYLDKSFRPTHVSTDSSIPYDTVLRGAQVRGHNLLSIPASLTDRVQICRSARGSSNKHGRRYVGMINGRLRKEVSQAEVRTYDPSAFVSWAKGLASILNSQSKSSELFRRYMPTCAPPPNPVPRTICLDLLSIDVTLTTAGGKQCDLKSLCATIESIANNVGVHTYTCSFELAGDGFGGKTTALRLEYDTAKRRFWFHKHSGESVRVTLDGAGTGSTKSLAEFLNLKQDIVLIGLSGGDIVYQGRNFYRIDYSYAEEVLLDLIVQPSNGLVCSSEKGTKAQLATAKKAKSGVFPAGSLFRAIADRRVDLPFKDELLVCDDLGTESGDFVAANFGVPGLALVHAKDGGGAKISASAFHDVTAQAMKNLVYLTRNAEMPQGIGSWRRNAMWNNTGVARLCRLPTGSPTGETLWKKLKADIVESSNPQLYVVLLTTGCCDLAELKKAARDPQSRTPEIAQLLHLLDGLNGYARQLGIRLMVYDVPYRDPN